jgi:solute carrier family 15 (oligopeptide transporter), member 1
MTGELGNFTLKPDQMQVVNPLLILLFVPLFDYVLYPLLAKVGIKRPLQKLVLGGLLAATAFVVSALLELKLEVIIKNGLNFENRASILLYTGNLSRATTDTGIST